MSQSFKTVYVVLFCLSFVMTASAHLAFADNPSAGATTDLQKAEEEINKAEAELAEVPETPRLFYDKTANPGIEMLDRAMTTRLNAEKLADLAVIASYCEKALELGLDEFNTEIAKTILATTLFQRAQFTAKAAFQPGQGRTNWVALRKIALRDLEKAIQCKPNYPDALFLLVELQLLPGGDKKAASKALDQLLASQELEPERRKEALLLRANLEEELPEKQAFLDRALDEEPTNLDALRLRGLTLMTLGKNKEARVDLEKALEMDPKSAETCEALATVLIDLDETEEAEKIIEKLKKLSPNSIAPLTIGAQLYAKKNDLPAALDALNHALELEPNNVGVLFLRSYLYYEMKLPKQAMADVQKVLKIRPQFDQARRLQIALLAEKGDLNKTFEELKKLHEEQPDDSELTLQLAMLYMMKRQPTSAIKLFTELLEKNPKNAIALQGRADALLGIGKQAEAIDDFNKALVLEPNRSDMLNNLAWVLSTSPDAKLRNGNRAIDLAKKACELTEYKEAHILSTLAAAYAEAGDFEQAIKVSAQAVELGKKSENAEIQEALQKELDTYKAKKPWREILENGLPATASE